MKKFDLLGYIRKYRLLIVFISLFAGLVSYFILGRLQTYTASAIIRYANSGAMNGQAPDGTTIDTTEIYSSQVITTVFSNLGLDYTDYNVDDLRSRVVVEPIKTAEQAALDEAKTSMGEETTEQTTEYKVSFVSNINDSSEPDKFARDFLDEMLDVYIRTYGENHINFGTSVNDISKLDQQGYDYLEQAEILKNSVSQTVSQLIEKDSGNRGFRSSLTGYSFGDLKREFDLLYKNETSSVYSYLLNHQTTKNRAQLISKYENRINDYLLSNQVTQEQIDSINRVIDAYVQMMRESGNTNITFEYIMDELHENLYYQNDQVSGNVDQTVEYEKLLSDYITANINYESALIDIAYCRYIINVYNGYPASDIQIIATKSSDKTAEEPAPAEGTDPTPATAAKDPDFVESAASSRETSVSTVIVDTTDLQASAVSPGHVDEEAQAMINNLASKMEHLYQILETTNEEFNEYAGSQNINLVSSIAVAPLFRLLLYVGLIVIAFGIIGCMGAAIAGRIGDIFEYYVYIDHKLGFPNRTACDRVIASYRKKLLAEKFTCISVRIQDLKKKNQEFGREATDDMILKFTELLNANFSREEDTFCGLNGVGQYLIFSESLGGERAHMYMEELKNQVQEENKLQRCQISYEAGIAEAHETGIYEIKQLMLKALTLNNASYVENTATVHEPDTEIYKKLQELRNMLGNIS